MAYPPDPVDVRVPAPEPRGTTSAAWWRHDCRLNVRELPPETLVCDHCGERKPVTA